MDSSTQNDETNKYYLQKQEKNDCGDRITDVKKLIVTKRVKYFKIFSLLAKS